jgi:tRNA(fMet)-specific endonuclease VapC
VKRLLLDTDACIEIIRGNPKPIDQHPDVFILMSTISRFEILSGLRKSRGGKREKRAKAFLNAVETLPFDETAANQSATVRIYLENAGTPIGAYDLQLAGHALALGCPILTGNVHEFERVPGLEIVTWR